MAAAVDDADGCIDVCKIPVLDLRSFCQDEIHSIAQFCGNFQEERMNFVISSAINKSIFNESSGSRRQTYDRHRVSLGIVDSLHSDFHAKAQLFEVSQISGKGSSLVAQGQKWLTVADLKEKQSVKENQELIDRICKQMQKCAYPRFSVGCEPALQRVDGMPSIDGCAEQVVNHDKVGEYNLSQVDQNLEIHSGFGRRKAKPVVTCNDNFLVGMKQSRENLIAQDSSTDIHLKENHILEVQSDQLQPLEKHMSCLSLRTERFTGLNCPAEANLHVDQEDSHLLKNTTVPSPNATTQDVDCNKMVGEVSYAVQQERNLHSKQSNDTEELKTLNEDISGKHGKRMRTKEEARRRSTMGEAEIAQFTLKRFCSVDDGSDKEGLSKRSNSLWFSQVDRQMESELPKQDEDAVNMLDAEGFPKGWKVSVTSRNEGGQVSSQLLKYISPDGQEWISQREALEYARSTYGQATLIGMNIQKEPRDITITSDSKQHKGINTELPEAATLNNIMPYNKVNRNVGPGKKTLPLCSTCGVLFYNLFSLRRHLKTSKHGALHFQSAETDNANNNLGNGSLYNCSSVGASVVAEEALLKQKRPEDCEESSRLGKSVLEDARNHCEEKIADGQGVVNQTSSINAVKDIFVCNICRKLFDSLSQRNGHLSVHTRRRSHRTRMIRFECAHCHKVFDKYKSYLGHTKGDSLCMKKLSGALLRIKRKKHRGGLLQGPFVCEKCGKSFDRRVGYSNHRRARCCYSKSQHSPARLGANGKCRSGSRRDSSKFSCVDCGKLFDRRRHYNDHLRFHHRSLQKACSGVYEPSLGKDMIKPFSINVDEYKSGCIIDPDTASNERKASTSSVFQGHTDLDPSGQLATISSGGNLDSCDMNKGEQVRDVCDTTCATHTDAVYTVPLEEGAGAIKETSQLFVSVQVMRFVGWSAEGCFLCRQAGGDSTQLVCCSWCEKEFHRNCLRNSFLGISDGWHCPFCNALSETTKERLDT